ncbi:TPA: type II toxin-antitoxin system PemK/MazF family toxin [Clostridium botulinum]|nr:type II toxin-antitoxin system PemK/MazF family toxin [Clostridium botulinum]HDK7206438.1 type II toxin-antitoxin system PemK/MazF family toxin [Clostridium botulinum]HDK7210174.1 type II toxin-antitoxin system PemK/MazF family toxin [Clostridium botulinum]HDK7265623.1 type II toxin-antitoxin system PemK/MazF family toxin [Clostridium botulinum]HDK7269471.1 type II toxin-antitoxin system PemK/MazF family toxin [Clostridium botulinum]
MLNTILKRGDIIEVNLGELEKCKQGGIRPCIVVANNLCNKYSPVIHVVPITSKLNKKKMVTHIFIEKDCMNNLKYDSLILAEQINLINVNQILGYIGKASDILMRKVDKKLKLQLALEDKPNNKFNERRILSRAKSLKELEMYIDKQKEKPADLLNILKTQVIDLRDYCEEHDIDCSKYYVSKFNIINRYLQRNIAA